MQSLTINGDGSFSAYGKVFQEKIFQGLLTDHRWAAQIYEVMNPTFFDVKYLSFLAEKYFAYYIQYKSFPNEIFYRIKIKKIGMSGIRWGTKNETQKHSLLFS